MFRKIVLVSLLATGFTLPSFAYEVIGIADGDTLTLLVDNKPVKIRLANIDAPEKHQPFGQRSKQSLADICWKKNAEYQPQSIDRYGRTVAVVRCNGVEANRRLVEQGMAWVYFKYNRDESLGELERAARVHRSGLWNDPNPVPPWDWRKQQRGAKITS